MPTQIYMTDSQRYPLGEEFYKNLPKNTMVIIREYDAINRSQQIQSIASICKKHKIPFSISSSWQLAIKLNAHGVHIPQYMRHKIPSIISKLPSKIIVSASAHERKQLYQNAQLGCDASILSPVFSTKSHPGTEPLRRGIVAHSRDIGQTHDVYALGGINGSNVRSLKHRAFSGIAGISCFVCKD